MDNETKPNQGLRAISLDDEAQVRRWAAILGAATPRRLSRRLSPYLDGAAARTAKGGRDVGIGGRGRS